MALIASKIDEYCSVYSTKETDVLSLLNKETMKKDDSIMLSGHLQGSVLTMLSKMINPSIVLEIGTYTGYSAICLAMGLAEGGLVHTVDINKETSKEAEEFVSKTEFVDKICFHVGDTEDIISTADHNIDIVFIDADKVNYSNYYDMVFDKVRKGGYIIADNALYDEEVLLPDDKKSRNGLAIQAFNDKVKNDNRVEHVLIPVRDGLMVVRKL